MIALVSEAIDLAAIRAHLACPQAGAEVLFTGLVRDHNEGRAVTHLEFESFAPMALRQLALIAGEIRARWDVSRVALVHRLGRVEIGDLCVVVGVSSAHRAAAFEGSRHGIDRLKQDVPIWKRETFVGGDAWLANHP